jgi:hypothetical protein
MQRHLASARADSSIDKGRKLDLRQAIRVGISSTTSNATVKPTASVRGD